MKALIKTSLFVGALLLFTATTWALPINVGDKVTIDQTAWNNRTSDRFLMHDSTTGDDYNTFCLEAGVVFTWQEMSVQSVGTTVMDQNDPISDVTIWLYASYWEGLFGTHSVALMDQVQNAIWYAEDEFTDVSGNDITGLVTYDYTALVGSITDFSVTGWDIQVVNLVDAYGNDLQSQLVGAPVPEPATILLFGIGLIGLAGAGRKKTA